MAAQDSQGRYVTPDETAAAGSGSVASAAKTATTTGTAFDTSGVDELTATLVITAASGTNPTLDLTLETTADGTNYYTVGTFPQQTGTTTGVSRVVAGLGDSSRWKWTIGGTTPSFTNAINVTFDRT